MSKKSVIFGVVFILFIFCLATDYGLGKTPGTPVFNEKVMKELMEEGHNWRDLVKGSLMTYKYKISLESIMQLYALGDDWKKMIKH